MWCYNFSMKYTPEEIEQITKDFKWEVIDIRNSSELSSVKSFLNTFELEMDSVDYTIVIRVGGEIIATCSKLFNLVKCIAISDKYKGLGLSKKLVNKVIEKIHKENYDEAFIITKIENKVIFEANKFSAVYSNDKISFMTNRPDKVVDYVEYLKDIYVEGNNGAIVMNTNPFTFGHQFLIEEAAKQVDNLYIIPVLEDLSFFKYEERKRMMVEGVKHLKNVRVIDGTQYIISKSTFPSYFLKSSDETVKQQTNLDASIFIELFKRSLNIKKRFVGTEPFSHTTNLYNQALKKVMIDNGIELVEITRKELNGKAISASEARLEILNKNKDKLEKLLPSTTVRILEDIDIEQRLETDSSKIHKTH